MASLREEQITSGVKFLRHPQVSAAPLSQRVAFLEKKGLTAEEISECLARAGVGPGGDLAEAPYGSGIAEGVFAVAEESPFWRRALVPGLLLVGGLGAVGTVFKASSPPSALPPPPPPPAPPLLEQQNARRFSTEAGLPGEVSTTAGAAASPTADDSAAGNNSNAETFGSAEASATLRLAVEFGRLTGAMERQGEQLSEAITVMKTLAERSAKDAEATAAASARDLQGQTQASELRAEVAVLKQLVLMQASGGAAAAAAAMAAGNNDNSNIAAASRLLLGLPAASAPAAAGGGGSGSGGNSVASAANKSLEAATAAASVIPAAATATSADAAGAGAAASSSLVAAPASASSSNSVAAAAEEEAPAEKDSAAAAEAAAAATAEAAAAAIEATKSEAIARLTAARAALAGLRLNNAKETIAAAVPMLRVVLGNLAGSPNVPRYRRLSTANQNYRLLVEPVAGHRLFLEAVGFRERGSALEWGWHASGCSATEAYTTKAVLRDILSSLDAAAAGKPADDDAQRAVEDVIAEAVAAAAEAEAAVLATAPTAAAATRAPGALAAAVGQAAAAPVAPAAPAAAEPRAALLISPAVSPPRPTVAAAEPRATSSPARPLRPASGVPISANGLPLAYPHVNGHGAAVAANGSYVESVVNGERVNGGAANGAAATASGAAAAANGAAAAANSAAAANGATSNDKRENGKSASESPQGGIVEDERTVHCETDHGEAQKGEEKTAALFAAAAKANAAVVQQQEGGDLTDGGAVGGGGAADNDCGGDGATAGGCNNGGGVAATSGGGGGPASGGAAFAEDGEACDRGSKDEAETALEKSSKENGAPILSSTKGPSYAAVVASRNGYGLPSGIGAATNGKIVGAIATNGEGCIKGSNGSAAGPQNGGEIAS